MPNEDEQVRIQLNTNGMEWSSNNLFKLVLLLAAATGGDNNNAAEG